MNLFQRYDWTYKNLFLFLPEVAAPQLICWSLRSTQDVVLGCKAGLKNTISSCLGFLLPWPCSAQPQQLWEAEVAENGFFFHFLYSWIQGGERLSRDHLPRPAAFRHLFFRMNTTQKPGFPHKCSVEAPWGNLQEFLWLSAVVFTPVSQQKCFSFSFPTLALPPGISWAAPGIPCWSF